MTSSLTVIGGGVRSGKSRYALTLAHARGERRAFVATAQAFDDEMRARIDNHQREREGTFDTFEAPHDVAKALDRAVEYDVVVLDCLTLWLSNLLLRGDAEADILATVDATFATTRPFHLIVVTNEVGMGIVPESALGRAFRDLAGSAHQRLARRADELYLATLGVILRLRPAPVITIDSAQ